MQATEKNVRQEPFVTLLTTSVVSIAHYCSEYSQSVLSIAHDIMNMVRV